MYLHFSLDHIAQSLIQPDFGHWKLSGTHSFFEQLVPVSHHSLHKSSSGLKSVSLVSLLQALSKNSLFVIILPLNTVVVRLDKEGYSEVFTQLSLLQAELFQLLQPVSTGGVLQPSSAHFNCSFPVPLLLCWGPQSQTQFSQGVSWAKPLTQPWLQLFLGCKHTL